MKQKRKVLGTDSFSQGSWINSTLMKNKKAVIFGDPQLYGRKNYVFPVSYDDPETGRRKHKKVYTDESDLAKVLEKKEQYRIEFIENLSSKQIPSSPVVPLGMFIEDYLRSNENRLKVSTFQDYKRYALRFQKYCGSSVPLNSITPEKCYHFLDNISALYARDGARRALHAIFKYAKFSKKLNVNPFDEIARVKIPEKHRDYFDDSKSEFQNFYKNLSENTYKERTFKYACLLANETGMRSGEVRHLQLKDVDIKGKRLLVRVTDTFSPKSNKERYVQLSKDALTSIQKQQRNKFNAEKGVVSESEYLFCSNSGRPYSASAFSHLFKDNKDLFLPDRKELKFHSTRHSFGQNMYNAGSSIQDVSKSLGHGSEDITQKYYAKLEDYKMSEKAQLALESRPSIQDIENRVSKKGKKNAKVQELLKLLGDKEIVNKLRSGLRAN